MRNIHRNTAVSLLALLAATGSALAQQAPTETPVETAEQAAERKAQESAANYQKTGVFELGQITVTGGDGDGRWGQTSGEAISQDKVTAEDVRQFNRNTLDDALKNVPGVHVDGFGGSRNEKVYFIRGFDMFQAPLSVDGVRVYLPYDNRLDIGRFLTPDLSEVQVQKGYVSVLNGQGGMGGAVNLVTRKPTDAVDGEIRTGFEFGNEGDFTGYTGFASLGTLQENYYLQASGTIRDSDGFYLPEDFTPTNSLAENGGLRDYSAVNDWRVNIKGGFTPNATDEYTINYTTQHGEKNAPYHVSDPVWTSPVAGQNPQASRQRNWEWPYWDYESISFLSHTQIGEASYIKSKVFYNEFSNLLSAFDDITHTTQTQGRAFDSYYDEYGYGGNLEFGTELIPMNSLKAAIHYRLDNHSPLNQPTPDLGTAYDPATEQEEEVWSFAVENTFHATDRLDFVAGGSYDYRDLKKAEDWTDPNPLNANDNERALIEYPLTTDDAFNWQVAAIYNVTETGEVHASISDRTRFPTLWERFSNRFGDALPNPDLKAERAINYEVGGSETFFDTLKLGAAVFYSDVQDVIQGAPVVCGTCNDPLFQNQNVGTGEYYGVELKAEWQALNNVLIGSNYTFLEREIDSPNYPDLKPVGTPKHYAFLYAKWEALDGLTIIPSAELSSSRYSSNRFENAYYKLDGFALANLSVEYAFDDHSSITAGVRNILDKEYEVQQGFPEAGRSFFVTGRTTF
jgi:iron complex outermembrane receptor protein